MRSSLKVAPQHFSWVSLEVATRPFFSFTAVLFEICCSAWDHGPTYNQFKLEVLHRGPHV